MFKKLIWTKAKMTDLTE